ncbi:MAG: Nucleoside triphosphatase NudI [Parcubacteria group bacterium ADurb.Bin326]|nr:MAG: Nucleoside triphosphatase NudI [Parcubacteria group bacterium ADurb.Bin326]
MQKTFYRVSIKALVIKKGKVLLVQEPDGRWELPGGGMDSGETPEQCLKRELKEELGATPAKISDRPACVWSQEVEKKGELINRLFLAYSVKLKSENFKITEEAIAIGWFTKKEMTKINLHINIKKFAKLYNPKDI